MSPELLVRHQVYFKAVSLKCGNVSFLNGNLSVMEASFCGEQNRSELWTAERFN